MPFKLWFLFGYILIPSIVCGQSAGDFYKKEQLAEQFLAKGELKNKMCNYDYSKIWTKADNAIVYGFIGVNYQRIRIKLISVTRDRNLACQYNISGKSTVKTNICSFKGTININSIRKFKVTSNGVDDTYKSKGIIGQYTILGNYLFSEDAKQAHSGIFKGAFQSEFYLTKDGKIHYDDIEIVSDGYCNNQFIGTWQGYNSKTTKRCNWGDYRIPNSGDLDSGAGDFSPIDKYLPYGWQSVRDLFIQGPASTKAKREENRIWWR